MHLKKLLALGLSLTMAVALLSGCGQQETAEGLSLIHISEPTRRS